MLKNFLMYVKHSSTFAVITEFSIKTAKSKHYYARNFQGNGTVFLYQKFGKFVNGMKIIVFAKSWEFRLMKKEKIESFDS